MNAPMNVAAASWRPDNGAVTALVAGQHGDPFAILGMHGGGEAPLSVRVFWPGADKVEVLERDTGTAVASLEQLHSAGFFAGQVEGRASRFPIGSGCRAGA
jgi:1,4-alpha-glucan branching enzyme